MSDDLPEGWVSTRLDSGVVEGVQPGFACGANNRDRAGVPHLRPMNVTTEGRISLSDVKYVPGDRVDRDARWVSCGDVLFNNTNSPELVGKTALYDLDEPRAFSNHMTRVRTRSEVLEAEFAAKYLHHLWREGYFQRVCNNHVSQASISREVLLSTPIPIPPLPEQRRIVEKVEALLAQVDAAKERLERVPAILKRFRQSVLAAACSGRLTDDWREATGGEDAADDLVESIITERRMRKNAGGPDRPRSGTTERRQVEAPHPLPERWCWVTWDDLADWITYGFTRPMPHEPTGVPIVTARHITGGKINFSECDLTSHEAFAALSAKDLPKVGELLVTKDGSIGRVAVVDDPRPFCINQSVAVVRFGGRSGCPHYLARVMESPLMQTRIDDQAKGAAIRHISITALGKMPVPLPPLDEQVEIAARVDRLLGIAESIGEGAASALRRTCRISDAILARAFRGELVPTEADLARHEGRDYESAEELLGRIKAEATEPTSRRGRRKAS